MNRRSDVEKVNIVLSGIEEIQIKLILAMLMLMGIAILTVISFALYSWLFV